MAQSKIRSLKEACADTFIGFGISLFVQLFVAHAYHANLDFWQNIQITLIFTVVSLARRYIIRRWFNKGDRGDTLIVLGINEMAKRQWKWVEKMGWHTSTVLERLALICSEVGEAVNECRGEKPTEKFGSELADIILRTMDLAESQNINIAEELIKKMAINEAKGNYKDRII